MKKIGVGKIASVMGRYYAMDRDNNYDRVQLAYDAMTEGKGLTAACGICGIQESYDREETDEFVKPTVVVEDGKAVGLVQDKDSVIFFNFRPDRAREITRAFCDDDFKGFDRVRKDITFVCFSDYDPTIPNKEVAFHKIAITNTFGEWLAAHDMKQARIAETEKYAHVTFFFNGGVEQPNEGEDRILVNSPKDVATYDLKPEMSAPQVCGKLLDAIRSEKYDVIVAPAAPTTAPELGKSLSDPIKMYLGDIYTISVNLAGLPGITIPVGKDSKGLPVGMQLIGNCFEENKIIQTAYTFEQTKVYEAPELAKEDR